jgi:hypothetical protein
MLKRFRNKSGQSIGAEMVITFTVVVLAVGLMSQYVKRTLSGRTRDLMVYARDEAMLATRNSDGAMMDIALQYEPYYVNTIANVEQSSTATENINATGGYNKVTASGKAVMSNSMQLAPKDWN